MKEIEEICSKAMEGYVEPKWFHLSEEYGWRLLKNHPELNDDMDNLWAQTEHGLFSGHQMVEIDEHLGKLNRK